MCRLYALLASAPTHVECGLTRAQNALLAQSRSDRQGMSHPDGWGIGLFEGDVPWVHRRAQAAYEDLRFGTIAASARSHAMIAHVRRSTVGGAARENTHPFVWGRWLFAHNGTLRGFDRLAEELSAETEPFLHRARLGTTDSEAIFLWMLSRLGRGGVLLDHGFADVTAQARIVGEGVAELDRRSTATGAGERTQLNLVLTDGHALVATRWHRTLVFLRRAGVPICGACGSSHVLPEDSAGYRAVLVASEPISDEAWEAIPDEHLLAVDRRCLPSVSAIGSPAGVGSPA